MQSQVLDTDTALLTARTVVRRFRENDGPEFFSMLRDNHARLIDHFPDLIREVSDEDQGEFFIRRKLAAWLLQEEYAFGIWEHDSAKLIGYIRLFDLSWTLARGELTYFIDHFFAGKGLMTESLTAVIAFSFEQLHLNKLCQRTAMDNYPSQRLARKVGFRREGDLREECRRAGGELLDVMLFGLTRSEYEKF
jgi:RimJ/RimL family protein N-acetyltransferase